MYSPPAIEMNKLQRIRVLRLLGLNTEEDILVQSEQDWQTNAAWLNQFTHYTVRTFREGPTEQTEPYHAIISRADFAKRRHTLLRGGWKLIVAAPIDPTYAEFAGAILREGTLTQVEIARRPGAVVRMVTHEGLIDKTYTVRDGRRLTGDQKVDDALRRVYEVEDRWSSVPALSHVIYEFSYYQIQVGWKREHAIFWEITGIDSVDPGIDLAQLRSRRVGIPPNTPGYS